MSANTITSAEMVAVATLLVASMQVASFAAADTGIFVINVDGSGERKVVQAEGFASHASPRWSHDGRQLAFEASEGPQGERKFFIVQVDGSGLKQLGEHGAPDWSPDDKQLAYHDLGAAKGPPGIWVENSSGEGAERLCGGSWPRWSPDGSRLAFSDGQSICLLDLVAGETKLLVDESFAQRPTAFDWSRDGKRLAYVARREINGPRELFIVATTAPAKAQSARLSRQGNFGGHVSWSPDDKQLAITIDSLIYLLEVAGNAEPRQLPGQSDLSRDPAWSPDGNWIAFARCE